MTSRFSMPTPCSPVMVPPASTQRRRISAPAATTFSSWPGSASSKRMLGCRLPSPAGETLALLGREADAHLAGPQFAADGLDLLCLGAERFLQPVHLDEEDGAGIRR